MCSLADEDDEDIVGVILDGTAIGTRIDRKATHISVLAAIGIRRDGRKVLLCIGNMGGESPSWRQVLEGLAVRGLQRPGGVVVDGAPGPKAAPVALWGAELPIQRCTGHKHRNLLAHASEHMQDEFGEYYRDTIHAETATEEEKGAKPFHANGT